MPGKLRHRTLTRRTFIKASAASGAALAAGPVFAPAVHAQARPIKIGYVSPATGPLAPFAAADEFMLKQFQEATKGGLKVGNGTRPIEVLLRDSQSNPNRAAEVAKELIVRDKNIHAARAMMLQIADYYRERGLAELRFVGRDPWFFAEVFSEFERRPAFWGSVYARAAERDHAFVYENPLNWTIVAGDADC